MYVLQYACPSATCQSSMASHVRRFVHDTASILVIIRQLANPVNCAASTSSSSGNSSATTDDRTILMWSWCKKCKQVRLYSDPHPGGSSQFFLRFGLGVAHRDHVERDVAFQLRQVP